MLSYKRNDGKDFEQLPSPPVLLLLVVVRWEGRQVTQEGDKRSNLVLFLRTCGCFNRMPASCINSHPNIRWRISTSGEMPKRRLGDSLLHTYIKEWHISNAPRCLITIALCMDRAAPAWTLLLLPPTHHPFHQTYHHPNGLPENLFRQENHFMPFSFIALHVQLRECPPPVFLAEVVLRKWKQTMMMITSLSPLPSSRNKNTPEVANLCNR